MYKPNFNNTTTSEEVVEKSYRNFMFLLYPDSTSYNFEDVLLDLKGSFKNYAYIKHKPEDDELKEHYHFILALDNARTIKSIAKRVGIPINHIKVVKTLRGSCRYLTHIDQEEKIQYDISDVKVSRAFQRKFYGAFDDLQTEQDQIDDIYCFIDAMSPMSLSEAMKMLVIFVNSNFYDKIYKRYRPEFIDYLKEKVKLT